MDGAAQFCTSCGKSKVAAAPAIAQNPAQKLANHLKVMGVLWLVYSIFRIIASVGTLTFSHYLLPLISSSMPHDADTPDFSWIFGFMQGAYIFSFILGVIGGILGIAAAIGLLQRLPWGRVVALIAAFVCLISIPFGTAMAIYTMIILFSSGNDENYRKFAVAT
jgi:hypothetical protein